MIEFTVYGKPAQMGSKKAFISHTTGRAMLKDDNNEHREKWANAVTTAAAVAMAGRVLYQEAIHVELTFYFSRPQSHFKKSGELSGSAPMFHAQSPDIDKLIRCSLDAMTGVVFQDDKLVCNLSASRHWTKSQAGMGCVVWTTHEGRKQREGQA